VIDCNYVLTKAPHLIGQFARLWLAVQWLVTVAIGVAFWFTMSAPTVGATLTVMVCTIPVLFAPCGILAGILFAATMGLKK